MSTVRRFNASCPDCGRWRCVCDAGCPDCGEWEQPCACIRRDSAEAYDNAMAQGEWRRIEAQEAVRVGPPSPVIRARLAALRAEFAERRP